MTSRIQAYRSMLGGAPCKWPDALFVARRITLSSGSLVLKLPYCCLLYSLRGQYLSDRFCSIAFKHKYFHQFQNGSGNVKHRLKLTALLDYLVEAVLA